MKSLKITWIGAPKDIQTKYGLKQKFSIKAQEQHGDSYLDVWSSPVTKAWKVGDTVEVQDVVPRDYNGKTYWDIKMPKANAGDSAEVMKKLEEIMHYLAKHNLMIQELVEDKRKREGVSSTITGTDIPYPQPENEKTMQEDDGLDQLNDEDIPF